MTDERDGRSQPEDGASADAQDLRRGVAVNMVGYGIKLAHPLLLAVATQLYGAERFGVFVVTQAAVMMLARLCLLGLDKGLLWWVPRQDAADERSGVLGALLVSMGLSSVAAAALWLVPDRWLALWSDETGVVEAIRLMAVGTVPLVGTEVLLNATMGKRRMEPQVLVRETLVPLGLLGAAVVLWLAGSEETGLPLAFVLAHGLGLLAAAVAFRRLFRHSRWPQRAAALPAELRRYAGPWWLSEITNTALLRTDILVLAAVTEPFVVGVYGVVVQFANAVRSIRRSFDPIVTAIVSRISTRPDPARLAAGYSYATVLVTATQVPVFVFLALFGEWLLPLYGEGFEAGTGALLVFCAIFGLLGPAGLAGIVVAGYGRSGLTLLNVVVALAVQIPAVWWLGGLFGLEGAAAGVGLAYAVQHALQLVEMRVVTGQWNYTRAVLPMLTVAATSVGLAAATYFLLHASADDAVSRIGAFAVFAIGYGAAVLHLFRTGRLSASPTA